MLIEGHDVSVTINGRPIIQSESLRCEPGTMTALVGPSGSGKTTLLHCLGLLLPVTGGRVLANGRDMTRASNGQRRRFWRDHAAFVLQDYGIMEDETVAFNVTMRTSRNPRLDPGLAEALERTGLSGREADLASLLSGGEKQRLALARALHRRASLLLVDEPTASLDAGNRRRVIDLFTDFAAGGATVIIATHDDEMIAACGHRHDVGDRAPAVVR